MNFKNLETIAAFFEGSLSEKETDAFRQKMESDADFAEEVRLFQLSKSVIRENRREQLLADTAKYMEEFESKPTKVVSFRRILSIAAGVLILVGVGFWAFQNSSGSSPEKLFAQHFEFVKAPGVRGTEAADLLLKAGYDRYSSGDFEQAIIQLNQAIEKGTDATNAPAYFYLGMSHLMLENYDKAASAFQKVSPESSYQQQAVWYEALVYLKAGKIDLARTNLKVVMEQIGHYKKKEAAEILENLSE